MKVNCCWNEAHVSTMTEDRANQVPGRGFGEAAQSPAGGGLGRFETFCKKRLSAIRNELISEYLADRSAKKTWRRRPSDRRKKSALLARICWVRQPCATYAALMRDLRPTAARNPARYPRLRRRRIFRSASSGTDARADQPCSGGFR